MTETVMDEEPRETPANLHNEYRPPDDAAATLQVGDPPYHGEAAVDIVAVHGLASKYPRTWSVKRDDGSRFYWLSEKLPLDMPHARVLGFEYASQWYGDPNYTNLRECAAQLLRCLVADRCHIASLKMCPTKKRRPIVLIGHSFGGLVIKQALVMAAAVLQTNSSAERYENYRDLLSAVAGVIFLGTPHRGSAFSAFAEIKMAFGRMIGRSSHDELIRVLRVDSPTVSALQQDFNMLYGDTRLSGLKIICYVETKELLVPPRLVVSRESACMDYAANRDMNANHMEMGKFHEGHDQNYEHVLADIREICQASKQSIPDRFAAWHYASHAPSFARERLLQWLAPSRETQKTAYLNKLEAHQSAPYTCRWIQKVSSFQDFLSSPSSSAPLWITGKAGSGKSVLAAYLISFFSIRGSNAYSDRREGNKTACEKSCMAQECGFRSTEGTTLFFFYGVDRANETPTKVISTLIHQLLAIHGENDALFSMAYDLRERERDGTSAVALSDLLLRMSTVVGSVTIVLDGLEESPTFHGCAKALSALKSQSDIKLILLSQHTDSVSQALEKNLGSYYNIVMTEYTKVEIDRFAAEVVSKLCRRNAILKDKEQSITTLLQNGAQGMFKWVDSVSDYLEQETEHPEEIKQRLDELPSDLISTYEKILERMASLQNDRRDRRVRVALQFLAVSGTAISASDLKTAFLISESGGDYVQTLLDPKTPQSDISTVSTDIKKLLGPLVEFPSADAVCLAHPSIRTAITREADGNGRSTTSRYKFSITDAHFEISKICMRLCSESTLVHANKFSKTTTPLLEYAWTYWPYHLHHSRRTRHMDHDEEFATLFGNMLHKVCGNTLAFLDAFVVLLCRPLRAVPGRFSDREYLLALQRAQDSLVSPTQELIALRNQPMTTKQLCDQMDAVKFVFATNISRVAQGSKDSKWEKVISHQKLRFMKQKLLGEETAVQRLKVDEHLEKLPLKAKPTGSLRTLLDLARHLRIVALRFAVDPIYSALILTAEKESFSPLHPLLYLAQFFEHCGTIPYWEIESPSLDLLEKFVCEETDPEFGPAKFVLSCFKWKQPHADGTSTAVAAQSGVLDIIPRPSGGRITRVSTENQEQVRRVHEMRGREYFVANAVYTQYASSSPDWLREWVVKPLSIAHMEHSLMTEPEILPYGDSWDAVLPVPQAVRESPVREYLRAVPHLLDAYFVQFVIEILVVFARLSRTAMAIQWARLETAIAEMIEALAFFSRFRTDLHFEVPRLRLWYLIPAAGLMYLRYRYFPMFGAYYMPHDWVHFPYAWRHPAAYLDLQNVGGFWAWLTTVGRIIIYNVLGGVFVSIGILPEQENSIVGHTANIYGVFHYICTIQRSIFTVLTVVATVVACALVMMKDPKTLSEIWDFGIIWWFTILFTLFGQALQQGAIQNGAGLGGVLVLAIIQVILIVVFLRNAETIIWLASYLLLPITAPATFLWNRLLSNYVLMMKGVGVITLLLMVLKAFKWTHKFMWDPYNVEGSLIKLVDISRKARSSLRSDEVLRVGYFPLGDKERPANRSIKDAPPKSALQNDTRSRLQQDILRGTVFRSSQERPQTANPASNPTSSTSASASTITANQPKSKPDATPGTSSSTTKKPEEKKNPAVQAAKVATARQPSQTVAPRPVTWTGESAGNNENQHPVARGVSSRKYVPVESSQTLEGEEKATPGDGELKIGLGAGKTLKVE